MDLIILLRYPIMKIFGLDLINLPSRAPSPPSSPPIPSPPSPSLSPPSPPPMLPSTIQEIQGILGYQFSDPKLVEEAMTHPSFYYPDKCSTRFQRLEHLGDAFLNFAVAQELFMTYSDLQPGYLTQLRAANVDNEKLARMAVGCELHSLLRHKAPAFMTQIYNFVKDMDEFPSSSKGLLDTPKILGDAIESLLGAVYVDSNNSYETVWKIFKRLAEPFITLETYRKNPVSELNELCDRHCKNKKCNFDDSHWDKDNTIDVILDEKIIGKATYGIKKDICQNRAAKTAVDTLKKEWDHNMSSLSPSPTPSAPPPSAMPRSQINAIEHILGYKFSDPKLVEEAMTHPSFYYPAECSTRFQRFEFLGDALLNFAMTQELFTTYCDLQPGLLTKLRAANVDNEKLAIIAVRCKLHLLLRYNTFQLETQIDNFVKDMDQFPSCSKGLLDTPKCLGDAIESLLGAVYIDSNKSYDTVWKIFQRLAGPFITLETLGNNPVCELNELCQKHGKKCSFDKSHWDKDNTIDVLLDREIVGKAKYGTKKNICQNRAAKVALDKLKKEWDLVNNEGQSSSNRSGGTSALHSRDCEFESRER